VTETIQDVDGLTRANVPPSLLRRIVRKTIHTLSYHFILKRGTTRMVRAAGFRLVVPPTVFHPRFFLASEYFAACIGRLDLRGKRVVDLGTGTGILALAAARAGAASVLAVDINPNAARAANENANLNGFKDRVGAVCSNLFSALAPRPLFDVILSNPPFFPGEPRDLADRAWHAGPDYRDIIALFDQARERLAPGGRFYVLLSSDSDFAFLRTLITRARFRARVVEERSIFIENLILYELRAQ
jgi:release factor glutamine methyltransferase